MNKPPISALSLVALLALELSAASTAQAFCGFYVSGASGSLYNESTKVVLMRQGRRTVLSMQNAYQGPTEDFAMVVPVPVVLLETDVKTLPRTVFDRVDQLAAPRLVEYWEANPCRVRRPVRYRRARARVSGGSSSMASVATARHGVTVEAEFAVGEYDIQILSARDSSGLDTWLREERYNIPAGAGEVLRPYVEQGTKFFVAKVDAERVTFEGGRAMLSPLRFHYDSDEFSLPVRLGLLNSSGTQDLIVHILAPDQRYEVANYPNAFIPTNLRVRNRVRDDFGRFYAALFDKTIQSNRGAVITEYAWQAMSCDPCPTEPLNAGELTLFGADVLPNGTQASHQMVLTRLHYRYDRASLGADLVFRPAEPVIGGRGVPNRAGRLTEQRQPGGNNQFQGRYVMLNWWNGPIECESPRRGEWGGPPNGVAPRRPPSATNTALIRQRRAPLERWIRDDVPEIRLRTHRPPTPTTPSQKPSTRAAVDALGSAGAMVLGSFFGLFVWRRRRR
jgi:hypothetical protein